MANPPKKKWCFTLNNPEAHAAEASVLESLECAHLVIGKEKGKIGTSHLQGYVNFRKATRMTALKKLAPSAHWEICISDEAAINYCKKEGDFTEKDNRVQGQRTDFQEIAKLAHERKFRTILDKHPGTFARYYKGIYAMAQAVDEPEGYDFPKEVHVRWGEPGSGKTRFFVDKYGGDLHNMQCHNGFWTRYGGQKIVIFDDFDGSWCKRSTFLQLTDRYKTTINVKGSQATWTPDVICITSNFNPRL